MNDKAIDATECCRKQQKAQTSELNTSLCQSSTLSEDYQYIRYKKMSITKLKVASINYNWEEGQTWY